MNLTQLICFEFFILLLAIGLNALKCYSCTDRSFSLCPTLSVLKSDEIQCSNDETYCAVSKLFHKNSCFTFKF